ncbi:ArsR/SmtB family transcription factor [Vulgatibacter incomptus]|uniref:Transcriptional regulator, ArsR family n=1 Tax=Vulgatibacter incomptus TaxID=1391653 RepID=A0A0K1PGD1_9BACT|nr:metalloregulator ArsR/SmtB family transcription factor [Vulgatibacter incomptus]AKU92562.1 Transcriptional regulator, ArsR family [Vulgatibacter incomptus]
MSRPDKLAAKKAAPLFSALGDETRLRLLRQLAAGETATSARLHARFRISRQAVTKHLQVLEDAGLVRSHRRGRERLWELEPNRIGEARAYLDSIAREWDDALERLRAFVEG